MTRTNHCTARSALRPLLGTVLLVTLSGPSQAAPINSNTAFAPHRGESIFRLQGRIFESGHDPSGLDRKLRVRGATGVYIYGFTERFSGILAVPYLDKSLKLTRPGGDRIRREANGLGDIRTLLKYRVYTKDKPGVTHRLGVFGGVEWPTGDDNDKDRFGRLPQPLQLGSGSWDPIAGLVWTTQKLGWEFDADLGYKVNTKANNFELGDSLLYNLSYQHRLWPRKLPEEGVPAFVYGVVEVNGSYSQENEIEGRRDRNSGGHTVFFSPGIQWLNASWVVEASVQFPIIQDLNGDGLKADYAATLGFRYRF